MVVSGSPWTLQVAFDSRYLHYSLITQFILYLERSSEVEACVCVCVCVCVCDGTRKQCEDKGRKWTELTSLRRQTLTTTAWWKTGQVAKSPSSHMCHLFLFHLRHSSWSVAPLDTTWRFDLSLDSQVSSFHLETVTTIWLCWQNDWKRFN